MSEVSVLSSDPVVISAGERSPDSPNAILRAMEKTGFSKKTNRYSFDPDNKSFMSWILHLFGRDFLQAWFVRGSISMIPFTIRMVKSGK